MLFEMTAIQEEFRCWLGVKTVEEIRIPDGDYRVPVYDEYFNVRILDNRMFIQPKDFDETKATVIP